MNQYILGIDAGGTKTEGLLKCLNSGETWTCKLGSGSLSNDIGSASVTIQKVAEQLLKKAQCTANETTVVCGAAGACNHELQTILNNQLEALGFNQVLVTTDAQISLYGAGKGKSIIVVALGTGTVAMRLAQDGTEKQFGGWGFIVGDQGGGAYIGKEIVTALLKVFDKDSAQIKNGKTDALSAEIFNIIGNSKQAILRWLKTATPSSYANLALITSQHIETHPIAKSILKKATDEVEQLIHLAQQSPPLPICLIGGLATVISPLLKDEIQRNIIPAKGNAIDGAIFIGEKLLEKIQLSANNEEQIIG